MIRNSSIREGTPVHRQFDGDDTRMPARRVRKKFCKLVPTVIVATRKVKQMRIIATGRVPLPASEELQPLKRGRPGLQRLHLNIAVEDTIVEVL